MTNGESEKKIGVPDSGEEFDRQIEQDILTLRRSSRWFASFGILAFLLLTCLVLFSLLDQSFIIDTGTPFIDIGFVKNSNAAVYDQPGVNGASVKIMPQGAGVFVLAKTGDWCKIQNNDQVGWMKTTDLETKTQRDASKSSGENQPVHIMDSVKWYVDEIDNYTIVGQIENMTDMPIESVKIVIDFYDADNNRIDTKTSNIRTDKSFTKGNPQNFSISGKHEKTFMGIDYRIAGWR